MFSTEPGYTEVNPGANDVLNCQVNNIGGECRWQKDGKVSKNYLPLDSTYCWFVDGIPKVIRGVGIPGKGMNFVILLLPWVLTGAKQPYNGAL